MMTSYYLLTFGVLFIFALHRVTTWMYARGWISWQMRRGTSSGLGNAMLGAQLIFQPQVREVLEVRLAEPSEAGESGDPPEPGAEGWGISMAADERRERGRVRWFDPDRGVGQIESEEFYDVLWVHAEHLRSRGSGVPVAVREGEQVEYVRHVRSGPQGPHLLAVDVAISSTGQANEA
ncbi:MAG: Cold-shock DNA-binding domain [Acidobacteriota bacterium]|jgi:cold shock CspA family protein